MQASEADFLTQWRAYAPAFPLSTDRASLILPFAGSGRQFRADFVNTSAKVAIEVQGGVWSGGKHGRATGINTDMQKLAIAQANGWAMFQVPVGESGKFLPLILRTIVARGGVAEGVTERPLMEVQPLTVAENPF
jgi:hypothetical protein